MKNIPAFPNDVKQISERAGMTLRDYFAAKAMQTILGWDDDYTNWKTCAENAYKMADAMLKAREE